MAEAFPMTGGDGKYSYAKYSDPQKTAADNAKGMIVSAIREHIKLRDTFPNSTIYRIADFGCSTGPNTFYAVKNIIDAVTEEYESQGFSTLPEFQVSFSDHVSNDFNLLFSDLPSERNYFATGVPGSFHNRLFPEASLDLAYSAFSIHWLSRVPEEITDPSSAAYNKGRISSINSSVKVGQAYSAQIAKDLKSFLGARAAEIVPGGLMVFLLAISPDWQLENYPSRGRGPFVEPLESTLLNLAAQGTISRDKLDSFNLPLYFPSTTELKQLINENGSFSIVRMDSLASQNKHVPFLKEEEVRATTEKILVKHFGEEIIEQLFERYTEIIANEPALQVEETSAAALFLLLKRNG